MDVETEMPGLAAKFRPYRSVQGKRELLGFAELMIGGCFVIKDITVVRSAAGGQEGEPFVSFPSKKGTGESAGKYFGVAHPVTAAARQRASEVILEAYRAAGR